MLPLRGGRGQSVEGGGYAAKHSARVPGAKQFAFFPAIIVHPGSSDIASSSAILTRPQALARPVFRAAVCAVRPWAFGRSVMTVLLRPPASGGARRL